MLTASDTAYAIAVIRAQEAELAAAERLFEDPYARVFAAAGEHALVLLGAGFDARALRLPEVAEANMQAFEIDFPAVLEIKRSLLEGSGVAIPGFVHHVGCDLASDFEERLAAELGAQGQPTMFIWEGVIAYIDQGAIDRSLHFMASLGGPGSRLIFDFSDYAYGPGWAEKRAREAGFTGFHEVAFDELWRRHLPGEPAANAPFVKLAIASKDGIVR
ncbi:MAG: SAM-dependent methyltransferase [Polyangiaceae bacterium]